MSLLPRPSLRWQVPAISAVILAVVVGVFGAIAYRAVHRSALEVAAVRVSGAVSGLTQPQQQTPAWIRELAAVANDPEVAAVVRSGGQIVNDRARARVASLTPDTGLTLATEIRDRKGTTLFSVAAGSTAVLPNGEPMRPRAARQDPDFAARGAGLPRAVQQFGDSAAQSPLHLWEGRIVIERAVPIRQNRQVIGHVVQVRRVVASPTVLSTLASLIGTDAALVVGNRDGSLWTDFNKAVEHPPLTDGVHRYERDGRRWIGATAPLPTGPWLMGVELPEDVVLAPVYALRWRLLFIGAGVVLFGVLITERLSRRLTVPLRRLTSAAEGIAAGHRAPVVPLDRADEIGRLSRAFAVMAESIRTSHDTLEYEIGERTEELRSALTQLQQTQDELVRKEKLATLGQVSGSIAHELRNPLGVMTNALFYLDAVLGDAPPKVREHLAKLRTQVRLSESIITGLLNFTRAVPPQVDIVHVAETVDEQLARTPIPASITVRRDIPHDIPAVRADPIHVGQILMNLFTNAVQAMSGGAGNTGILTVRARATGNRVSIEVADTGPGIAPEHRERVFEPLFTTKARGIGLGLSVSRSLAQANNGTLTVLSRLASGEMEVASDDGGAVVALELPAAPLVREADQQAQGETSLAV